MSCVSVFCRGRGGGEGVRKEIALHPPIPTLLAKRLRARRLNPQKECSELFMAFKIFWLYNARLNELCASFLSSGRGGGGGGR